MNCNRSATQFQNIACVDSGDIQNIARDKYGHILKLCSQGVILMDI